MDDWQIHAETLGESIRTASGVGTLDDGHAARTSQLQQDLVSLRQRLDAEGSRLPAYDRRKREETLKSLEKSLSDILPSKASKFSFKKAAVPSSEKTPNAAIAGQAQDALSTSSRKLASNVPVEENSSPTYLQHILPVASAGPTSQSYNNLSRCILDFRSTSLSSLYISDISDSIVIAPSIRGSVLIHRAQNCMLALGCHQFRMHSSTSVDVLIDTESTPIIEDCSASRFAFMASDGSANLSDRQVNDFSAPSDPSSNAHAHDGDSAASWRRLDPEDARLKYVIAANLPADAMEPGSIEQILSVVGLPKILIRHP